MDPTASTSSTEAARHDDEECTAGIPWRALAPPRPHGKMRIEVMGGEGEEEREREKRRDDAAQKSLSTQGARRWMSSETLDDSEKLSRNVETT